MLMMVFPPPPVDARGVKNGHCIACGAVIYDREGREVFATSGAKSALGSRLARLAELAVAVLPAVERGETLDTRHELALEGGDVLVATFGVAEPERVLLWFEVRRPGPPIDLQPLAKLNPRQREVVRLAMLGLTNKQIAERLDVKVATVANRMREVREALGVANFRQVVASLIASVSRLSLAQGKETRHPSKPRNRRDLAR